MLCEGVKKDIGTIGIELYHFFRSGKVRNDNLQVLWAETRSDAESFW